jgi:hypothetical protein
VEYSQVTPHFATLTRLSNDSPLRELDDKVKDEDEIEDDYGRDVENDDEEDKAKDKIESGAEDEHETNGQPYQNKASSMACLHHWFVPPGLFILLRIGWISSKISLSQEP